MMSHIFTVADEQYKAIEEAARERGQSPDEFFRSWIEAVRRHVEQKQEDPEQTWFWTPEWQAKEREADEAIAAHEGAFFSSEEAFLASLDEE